MGVWLLGGSQILDNPDFEVGSTSHWAVSGSSIALAVSSIDQYSGNYSALVTCSGVSSASRFYQGDLFTLDAGHSYFVRCAIRVASGTIADENTSWKITDESVSSFYVSADIVVSSLWKSFGLGWTQRTTINSMKFGIYLPTFTDPASANGGVFIDDVVIYHAVELDAGYGYKFGKIQNRIETHDRGGGLHSYILPGGYREFKFPGLNIDSAGRCAVNSFWANGDTCYLIEDDTDPSSMYAVKVMDVQEPFQSLASPGLIRYTGDLTLETTDAE